MIPATAGPPDAFGARANRRLVSVIRVLLMCVVVSLPTPLVGLSRPDPAPAISLAIMAVLFVLGVAYAGVLTLASRGHWTAARRIAFGAWALYGPSIVVLYDVDLEPTTQSILFIVGAMFMVIVQNATLSLAPWREARVWMAICFSTYLTACVFAGLRQPVDAVSYTVLVGVSLLLAAAAGWPARIMLRDLDEALGESDARWREARETRQVVADARDQALAANTAKSRFLANMSHELRTPLNAILGYVELLQDEARDQGIRSFDADLDRVHVAGTHLLGLINAILDLSKIEAGKMEVSDDRVDAGALLEELVATIRPLAHQKGLDVHLVVPTLGPFTSDLQKLRQVLLNLLANAVKFTDAGSVTVSARVNGGTVQIAVTDTGVGIALAQVEKIFDAFERTDAEVTRRVGGTGLGLAISRRICELLGGTLTVHSHVGRGSTFTVILPLAPSSRRRTTLSQLLESEPVRIS